MMDSLGDISWRSGNARSVMYVCQVVAIFITVIACLINLSINSDKSVFWSSLLSGSLGYLLPAPKLKRLKNESLLSDTPKQLIPEILSAEHSDGISDEIEK